MQPFATNCPKCGKKIGLTNLGMCIDCYNKLNPTTKMSDESKPSSNNGESELTQKESDE